ncbi:MAG: GreA/GreB family elongation factor [Flavobacteriales bacterium]|nr:GreA/GreB family elongation factor [Flavobacteriales bacterium]
MNKALVYEAALNVVDEKIAHAISMMDDAQQSANSDTKSSAGDKHETSRAMAMLEKDRAAGQLNEANKLKQILIQINIKNQCEKVGLGALVKTNSGLFYFSVGVGKIVVKNEIIFCISLASPLGQVLVGKRQGESVSFNSQSIRLLELS